MDLAFLIPSRDRHDQLRRHLPSVVAAARPVEARILIADQSRTPFPDPGPWSILHRPDLAGLPAARNLLLHATTAEWVVFLDDDVALQADFSLCLQQAIARHPAVDTFGPVVECRSLASRRLHRLCCHGAFRDPRRLTAGPVDAPTRALFGCCFAVRRSTALVLGGFDARLAGYALGEDLDFFRRLTAAGHRARFCRELVCVHHQAGGHPRPGVVAGFLLRQARRHGRQDPATPLHLALAGAAMLFKAWRTGLHPRQQH